MRAQRIVMHHRPSLPRQVIVRLSAACADFRPSRRNISPDIEDPLVLKLEKSHGEKTSVWQRHPCAHPMTSTEVRRREQRKGAHHRVESGLYPSSNASLESSRAVEQLTRSDVGTQPWFAIWIDCACGPQSPSRILFRVAALCHTLESPLLLSWASRKGCEGLAAAV